MKFLLLAISACVLGVAVIANPLAKQQKLVGDSQCTWGPSYWCYNITNAKSCHAVTHCIQTVWEKHDVPEDTDSICKICLDMVTQARDQLLSNATQEDLKAVFEGSCQLIPLKPVAKLCIKTVDNFVPELVEALSSEMNPQAVCSVAGLCNNAAIDKMLEDANIPPTITEVQTTEFTCKKCRSITSVIADRFRARDRDDTLEMMLRACGRFSSFSDACSNIALTYFNNIYDHFMDNFNPDNVCHMAGSCVAQYHNHNDDKITSQQLELEILPKSMIGVQAVGDDIPCELCKQLVHHLKDVLIANTTETEFKTVLEGLCKQTRSFKGECLSIVDQYYVQIYNTLVSNLSENEACCAIEICPRNVKTPTGDIMPLLPVETVQNLEVAITAKTPKKLLGEGEPVFSAMEVNQFQLPFDKLMPAPNRNVLVKHGDWCMICQYFMHFVQDALANTQNEEKIKQAVENTCDEISSTSIRTQCKSFIETYGDAIIALAIQGLAPQDICPRLFVCPPSSSDQTEVFLPEPFTFNQKPSDLMNVDIKTRNSGSEKCPLCLFAVQELQTVIKEDKSKENIRRALNGLCVHLPKKLQSDCTDFVETYTNELVNMLINDFTPQEICVQLSLCDKNKTTGPEFTKHRSGDGDIMTNEIPDDTINGQFVSSIDVGYDTTPNCLICQELMKEVLKKLAAKPSKEHIKLVLENACHKMRKLQNKCDALIEKYGDIVVDLIMKELTPKEICRELGMCILKMEVDIDNSQNLKVTVLAIPVSPTVDQIQSETHSEPITHSDDLFAVATDEVIDPNTAYIHASDSTACVVCQTIMTQLDKELQDKKTQQEIKDTVKNICHSFPKSFDAQCTKFIDSYATLIINLIDSTPPKEICGQINLCAPDSIVESKNEVIECAVCHAATQTLARVLEDPKVQHNVEAVLEKTCNNLPGAYNDRCVKLIEVYGPSMINIITKSGELHSVCTQIGMCYPDEYASFAQVAALQ